MKNNRKLIAFSGEWIQRTKILHFIIIYITGRVYIFNDCSRHAFVIAKFNVFIANFVFKLNLF